MESREGKELQSTAQPLQLPSCLGAGAGQPHTEARGAPSQLLPPQSRSLPVQAAVAQAQGSSGQPGGRGTGWERSPWLCCPQKQNGDQWPPW